MIYRDATGPGSCRVRRERRRPGGPASLAATAVSSPVAVYLLGVWALHVWPRQRDITTVAFPVAAVLVLAAPWAPAPIHVTAGAARRARRRHGDRRLA